MIKYATYNSLEVLIQGFHNVVNEFPDGKLILKVII